ncbi:MAG: inorganic diphosphatase [Nanoarchaeota archaeon]
MANINPWHDVETGKESPKIVNAIIEIPKDSKIKLELDKKTGMIRLDRFLFSSVHYPGDYGFIPQTYWEDDDPLDIIIFTGHPVPSGTLVSAKVVGVVHMIDGGEGDDKIIAVYEKDPRYKKVNSIKDLSEHALDELKHFFETYKQLEGKKVDVLGIKDKDEAYKIIERSKELYRKKFGK